MTKQWNYFNDLRTILIAHDKRMLALFHRKDIMRDYLDLTDIDVLEKHIAPTYVCGNSSAQLCQAKSNKEQWLVKPIRSGKGDGVVLGKSATADEWEHCLDGAMRGEYVLQRYVGQSSISMIEAIDNQVAEVSMNIVGIMLCFDDRFLGPGAYRASASDVVNVASGGLIVNPMLY